MRVRWLVVGIVILALVAVVFPHLPLRLGGNGETTGIRLVRDSGELLTYYLRSQWLPEGLTPYRDIFIEYPQLAAAYLVWPLVFVRGFENYQLLLVISNALIYLGLIAVTATLLKRLYNSTGFTARKAIWLFALPAMLYFVLYRFDVVAALAVMLSLWLLYQQRRGWALVLLGAAILIKWYALVLIPLYWWWLKRGETAPRQTLKLMVAFGVVLLAAVIVFALWFGPGFAKTYEQQLLARTAEAGTIFYFMGQSGVAAGGLRAALLVLQLAPAAVWLVAGKYLARYLKTFTDFILWSALAIMCFVFFAKFYSPQWLLWFVPLLMLVPLSKKLIGLIILNDLLNFLQFPVTYDAFGPESSWMLAIVLLRTIVFGVLIIVVAKRIIQSHHASQPAEATMKLV